MRGSLWRDDLHLAPPTIAAGPRAIYDVLGRALRLSGKLVARALAHEPECFEVPADRDVVKLVPHRTRTMLGCLAANLEPASAVSASGCTRAFMLSTASLCITKPTHHIDQILWGAGLRAETDLASQAWQIRPTDVDLFLRLALWIAMGLMAITARIST